MLNSEKELVLIFSFVSLYSFICDNRSFPLVTIGYLSFSYCLNTKGSHPFLKVAAIGEESKVALGVFMSTNKLYSSEGDWDIESGISVGKGFQ